MPIVVISGFLSIVLSRFAKNFVIFRAIFLYVTLFLTIVTFCWINTVSLRGFFRLGKVNCASFSLNVDTNFCLFKSPMCLTDATILKEGKRIRLVPLHGDIGHIAVLIEYPFEFLLINLDMNMSLHLQKDRRYIGWPVCCFSLADANVCNRGFGFVLAFAS
jgi:hypothetical protein